KRAAVPSYSHRLRPGGVPLIANEPRLGLAGRIGFLHPKACHGVLVELATPSNGEAHAESPVRFKRLVIGSPTPDDAAQTHPEPFGPPQGQVNGGPRTNLE